MHEGKMIARILLVIAILSTAIYAKSNISLAKTLMRFQGEEYNILLSPRQIVIPGKKKKTRKAINKGYKRAILELKRQVNLRAISLNLKIFTSKGSNLPQYIDKDIKSYELLKKMLEQQVGIREQLFEDKPVSSKTKTAVNKKISVDDIDIDEIGDDVYDISSDSTEVQDESGTMLNISPAETFTTAYVELSEQYNQEVLELYDVVHPFSVNNKPVMKNVHSVFGMAFFPTKYGTIKMMRVYVVLCNINTESQQSVQIIAKEIPNFKWDRNYLYISAATGKMLRQIISGVLGEPFLKLR